MLSQRKMRKVYIILVICFLLLSRGQYGYGQTTIFSENIGNPAGTTLITLYAGWQNNGVLSFSGTGDVRNTTPSSGYTGVSGTGNVFLTNVVGRTFIISAINTLAYPSSSLQLSFGIYKSTTAEDGSNLDVDVSSDGISYSPLSFTLLPTGAGTATWYLRSTTGTIPSTSNLYIRFTQASVLPQFRIDDVILKSTVINTYTSIQDGNWNDPLTWDLNLVPTSIDSVIIDHEVAINNPLARTGVTNVNTPGKLKLDAVFTDNGTTNVDGELVFETSGSISGNSPIYGSSSILHYKSSGTFNRGVEWNAISGAGYPNNVEISNNTTLDLGANGGSATSKQIAGDLDIENGSTLSMNISVMTKELSVLGSINVDGSLILSTGVGANLNVGRNWSLGGSGSFVANGKKVTFNGGAGTQYLTGNTTFYDLTLSNSGASTDFGTTTTTVVNDFSNSAGTMVPSTSRIVFTGSSASILGNNAKNFYDIEIDPGAILNHSGSGNIHVYNSFTNNGWFEQSSTLITYFDQAGAIENLLGIPDSTIFGRLVIGSGSFLAAATTLNSGAHNFTVTGSNITFNSNSSVFNGGGATVTISNACTIAGAVSITGVAANFYNINISNAVDFSTISTIYGTLQINSGGSVSNNAPTYATNSLLKYNTGNSAPPYDRWLEWNSVSGQGYPYNVQVSGNTTLRPARDDQSYSSTIFSVANNLTIDAGSEIYMDYGGDNMNIPLIVGNDITIAGDLSLSGVSPGDIKVGGDWTRTSTGNFYPNSRAVYFTGNADQNVSRTGGGIETFSYFIVDKPNSGTYVKPNNSLGDPTDITISGTSGNVLQLINNGSLDLNGRTIALDANSSLSATGFIYVNAARTITNSQGINNGKFEIKSSSNPNQPTWFTKSVANNAGVGSLIFDDKVVVTIGDGQMDFGESSGVNLTTIQGVLQVNLGGSVAYNSCYYSVSPASTLRFSNTVDYQVNATDLTWAAGSIYSGLPGIPYNVDVDISGTDLTINSTRAVRNNLTITDGSLTLAAATGNFYIGGNWDRSGATSAFIDNANYVEFGGNQDQTITSSANGNKETFFGLTINNTDPTPQVSLIGSTSVEVKEQLNLISGIVTTGSNEVYVMNDAGNAITGYQTDPTAPNLANYLASSYINGNLRREVVAGENYVFPVGTSSSYQYDSITLKTFTVSGASNILCFFTAGNTNPCTDPSNASQTVPVFVLGTPITNLLLGGYWTMTPEVTPTVLEYDITLQESSPFIDLASNDSSYAIIKRANCTADWTDEGIHDDATQKSYPDLTFDKVVRAYRDSVTSFSDIAIGYNDFFLLPVELTNFTVSLTDGISVLEWSTASEYNSHYFSIESSEDAIHFKEIGRMNAAGFSTVAQYYSFNDVNAVTSGATRIYYRLRMVDTDQTYQYSAVRWVDLEVSGIDEVMTIYPNPVHDAATIMLHAMHDQPAVQRTFDIAGKLIDERQFALNKGINFIELGNAGLLPSGIYFIQITSGSKFYTASLVKE
jgi:hypothetical protein